MDCALSTLQHFRKSQKILWNVIKLHRILCCWLPEKDDRIRFMAKRRWTTAERSLMSFSKVIAFSLSSLDKSLRTNIFFPEISFIFSLRTVWCRRNSTKNQRGDFFRSSYSSFSSFCHLTLFFEDQTAIHAFCGSTTWNEAQQIADDNKRLI